MTDNDVKKITKVVKGEITKALKPVNQKLDSHTKVLDGHSRILGRHTEILEGHSKILGEHTKILGAHSDKLDNHTLALVNIEATLKGYADMYKVNKDDNERLKQRVTRVETHVGITPQD